LNRRWTEEELHFLEDNVGKISLLKIAEKLNRPISGIEIKLKRLGLGNTRLASGKLTANELAKALNIDTHVVTRWLNECGLKGVKRATRISAKFHLISVENFWKWAEQNKERINFYKIEPNILVPEPDWVEEQRKLDYQTIPKRQGAKWTEQEDNRLIEMTNAGYKQEEIGVALNRSGLSVQRRLSRLREKRKIPMLKVVLPWSEEEVRMLLDLEKQGLSDVEIAYELGRDSNNISWKRGHLRKLNQYEGRKVAVRR
jgi:hypothetical protein